MIKRIYRSQNNKILGGVCAGIADYFELDPVLIRLSFAVLGFYFIGIIAYLIAWIIIPEGQTESIATKSLYRSKKEKILAGICGGIAEYFNADPVLVRLITIILMLFNGFGIIAYIIAWIIIPCEE